MASQSPEGDPSHAGETLSKLRWRQGALLDRDAYQRLCPDQPLKESVAFAILLNQDCDIVRHQDTEPWLEVAPCHRIEDATPNCLHGRNPRCFHIEAFQDRPALSIDIRERHTLSKQDVASLQAEPSTPALNQLTITLITQWLGKRYTRSAFPDEFNRRWARGAKKLDRLGKRDISKPVTAVYVGLDPHDEELDATEDYELYLYVAYRDDSKVGEVSEFFDALCELIQACEGLDLNLGQSGIKTHFDITLADLEEMRRWDLDYRSISDDADVVDADEGR